MDFPKDIFAYITTEETNYQTREIQVSDNVRWNMHRHLIQSFNLKNGWFINVSNDLETKHPFKNIILQILEFRCQMSVLISEARNCVVLKNQHLTSDIHPLAFKY